MSSKMNKRILSFNVRDLREVSTSELLEQPEDADVYVEIDYRLGCQIKDTDEDSKALPYDSIDVLTAVESFTYATFNKMIFEDKLGPKEVVGRLHTFIKHLVNAVFKMLDKQDPEEALNLQELLRSCVSRDMSNIHCVDSPEALLDLLKKASKQQEERPLLYNDTPDEDTLERLAKMVSSDKIKN